MSEQLDLQPLYIVTRNVRSTMLAVRDEFGVYRVCCVMQYPYDRHQAALKICEAMNTLGVEIESEEATSFKAPNVGLNVK